MGRISVTTTVTGIGTGTPATGTSAMIIGTAKGVKMGRGTMTMTGGAGPARGAPIMTTGTGLMGVMAATMTLVTAATGMTIMAAGTVVIMVAEMEAATAAGSFLSDSLLLHEFMITMIFGAQEGMFVL